MAEWLRRLTRNQMGSARAGSNPAKRVCFVASRQVTEWLIQDTQVAATIYM